MLQNLDKLFEAYGSQETKNLSAGALAMLGILLGGDSASEEMKENAIISYAATNDIISKLTREQLFGRIYPSLETAVLKTWLKIHPDVGMAIARFVGRNSRKYGENRNIDLDEYLAWANQALKKNDCVICVHGHHHIPGIWDVENGIVASPGEWMNGAGYGMLPALAVWKAFGFLVLGYEVYLAITRVWYPHAVP